MKVPIPAEIVSMVLESEKLKAEIQALRNKPRLSLSDLKALANFKTELLMVCPADRYLWLQGKPAVDIVKELTKIKSLH
jgi:hypothetical protein